MKRLLAVWNSLSIQRKALAAGAGLAILVALVSMVETARKTSFALLYAGLEPAAAGEVLTVLDSQGVRYEVKGGAILVPAAQRDQLRLSLAGQGLPASGSAGYELLDDLSGFATTASMFDAAYMRAKEGELARTILASPEISAARVHIAAGAENPFRRDLKPSASVFLKSSTGQIATRHARAIKYLVASAVTGMSPKDVSVIDSRLGVILADEASAVASGNEDRARLLRDRVQRLVDARVGIGNAVVEVSVETLTDSENIRETRFDPDSRFVVSSDTEEQADQSEDSGAGAVTVASNLPSGEASGAGSSSNQRSRTRERLSYMASEITREIRKSPGSIRRLSVAVLVNSNPIQSNPTSTGGEPAISEAELSGLRDLVAAAVGFDAKRGDEVTIRAMPFEVNEGSDLIAAQDAGLMEKLDPMSLIQWGILALVVLILGLFVIRPILLGGRRAIGSDKLPYALDAPERANEAGPVLTGTIETDNDGAGLKLATTANVEAGESGDDPVVRLRGMIEERRGEAVEILRNWLSDPQTGRAP